MRVYIIRHGKAQSDSPTGRDEDRALRKRGVKQIDWLAGRLADSGRPPGTILASPLLRAWDTARMLADALDAELVELPTLALGHPAGDVVESLADMLERSPVDALALVGHNPQLESLVAVLTEGPTGEPVRLRTGQCAVVDFEEANPLVGRGTLSALWRYDGD